MYPALSVAEALAASADTPALTYVGSEQGMEAGLVQRESRLPYRAVPAAALRGRHPLALSRNAIVLARGYQVARRLLAAERPDVILGTGGYVCVPVFFAARRLGVPTVIYLPDVVPGLAVKLLARMASAITCSVDDSRPYFGNPANLVVTGYPARRALFELDRPASHAAFGLREDVPVLLVTGGSRGARSINQAIGALLPHLLPLTQIIHVCGREGDEGFLNAAVAPLPQALQERYRIYPYLHSDTRSGAGSSPSLSMVHAFGAADLVVCRSGASTLGELPAAGLPALLVPYPFVHQDENADYLVRHGGAIKIRDNDMLGVEQPEHGALFRHLQDLLGDVHARAAMAGAMRGLARPDAAERLADVLLAFAGRRDAL